MSNKDLKTVSIKHRSTAYGSYRHLQNTPWFALAEFLDNSINSYDEHHKRLNEINKNYKLKIDVVFNFKKDFITIKDNAAGIDLENIQRAFEPGNIPKDRSGRSEFGMGMKISSIWFADSYTVKSKFYNENIVREVKFDLDKVIKEEKEELVVNETPLNNKNSFTEIKLQKLSNNISPQQIDKIEKHIESIYRKDINDRKIIITIDSGGGPKKLFYEPPKILKAPWYNSDDSKKIEWKEDFDLEFGNYSVKGYVALLEKMSTDVYNGLSLFRRGRVIVGSHDLKYRPRVLSGQKGGMLDKRLFGELELEGFDVSFQKGSFVQTQELETLLEMIADDLNSKPMSILKQGTHYTVSKPKTTNKTKINKAVRNYKEKNPDGYLKEKFKKFTNRVKSKTPVTKPSQPKDLISEVLEDNIEHEGRSISIKIELNAQKTPRDFYDLIVDGDVYHSTVFINHYFLRDTDTNKPEIVTLIMDLVKALVLIELTSDSDEMRAGFNHWINK